MGFGGGEWHGVLNLESKAVTEPQVIAERSWGWFGRVNPKEV
jgi:hypothetical protein